MRIKLVRQIAGSLFCLRYEAGMRWYDSQFQTSNIQICICGPVNLHRYCAVQRARGNSANYYSTSPSGILLSPGIACAPVRRSSGIKGRIMFSPVVFWSPIFRRFVSERRSRARPCGLRIKGKKKSRARLFDRKVKLKELDHRSRSLPIIWWWDNEKNIEPAQIWNRADLLWIQRFRIHSR